MPKGVGAKPKRVENNKLRKKFLEMTQAGGEDPEAKAEKEKAKKEKAKAKKEKKKKKAAADEASAITEADDATAATATTAGSVTTAGVGAAAAKAGDDADATPHVPIERDAEEGKKFWFSVNTKQTQWVAPYENDTFETEDFDMGVFIELFLERNILALSLIHI